MELRCVVDTWVQGSMIISPNGLISRVYAIEALLSYKFMAIMYVFQSSLWCIGENEQA